MSNTVNSRQELSELVTELSSEDHSQWENCNLESFLEALGAWLNDCKGYYINTESNINPDEAQWQVIADAVRAAKIYE